MAYRKLLLDDVVRITDMSDDHGSEGTVIETTGTGAKVRYRRSARDAFASKWFNARNLCIVRDAPQYVTSATTTRPLTPAEKLGYKVGDKFIVEAAGATFKQHSIVIFYRDDGSSCPLFKGEGTHFDCADGERGAYVSLHKLKPYKEEKQVSQFKVGDRVRVISNSADGFYSCSVGKVGTVKINDHSSMPLLVHFEDGSLDWGCYDEVELVVDLPTDAIKEKLAAIDKLVAEVRGLLG